jgi:hypothetical protein
MNPISCFLNDVENNRLLLTILNNLINDFYYVIYVVSGESCYGLDLVSERSVGIVFGELKHDIDLVLQLIAFVRFA